MAYTPEDIQADAARLGDTVVNPTGSADAPMSPLEVYRKRTGYNPATPARTLITDIKSVAKDPVGSFKALSGGVAKGVGVELVGSAIDYAGRKAIEALPDTFQVAGITKQQRLENLSKAPSINEQFEKNQSMDVHPNLAATGEVSGFVGSVGPALVAKSPQIIVKGKEILSPVSEALAKRSATKESDFIKDLITPELNVTKTANAIKTGKVTEGGIFKDRDITGAVPFFEDTTKAVSEVPGISKSKTLLENANHIHDHIGTVADDLVSQLKTSAQEMKVSEIAQVPAKFNQYMKGVKATLKENPTLVGDAEKTATKILDKFESLVKEEGSTPDAIISARKKLDTWMSLQKGDNVFDPKTEGAVSVALRAIRQGGNDFVASLSKDVAVKDMLAKQTSLYNAIENIAPKAAKEGSSGFKRWVKSHPKIVRSAKILGAATVGGGVAGSLLNQ